MHFLRWMYHLLIKWVLHLHIMNLVTSSVTPRAISLIKFDGKIGGEELACSLRSNFGLSKKMSDISRILSGEGLVIIFFFLHSVGKGIVCQEIRTMCIEFQCSSEDTRKFHDVVSFLKTIKKDSFFTGLKKLCASFDAQIEKDS